MELIDKTDRSNFLIKEYEKLKDEQSHRIGFRDQMIFITLGAIGSVFSFSILNPAYSIALLILPFITFVLGWTYLMNDDKITSIGVYIRTTLSDKVKHLTNSETKSVFEWEEFIKIDRRRTGRKFIQFIIDISRDC